LDKMCIYSSIIVSGGSIADLQPNHIIILQMRFVNARLDESPIREFVNARFQIIPSIQACLDLQLKSVSREIGLSGNYAREIANFPSNKNSERANWTARS